MGATPKLKVDDRVEEHELFNIHVCSDDGRLLDEYSLTRKGDNVVTLDAAETHIRDGLSDYQGEPLVIFVNQETLTKFRQLQIKIDTTRYDAALSL
jgi:hypothetical protein